MHSATAVKDDHMLRAPRIATLLALALTGLALAGPAAGAPPAPPVQLRGTAGPDSITGTPGMEIIRGMSGDDVIDGHGGGDDVVPGLGRDTVTVYAGDYVDARSWPYPADDIDTINCVGRPARLAADPWDVLTGDCDSYATPLIRTDRPLQVVYDHQKGAEALFTGGEGVGGLSASDAAVHQMPSGTPFPKQQLIGKVRHDEIARLSPRQLADLMVAKMGKRDYLGDGPQAELVGFDELGSDMSDARKGPKLLAAMRILSKRRHPETGEPLSRRVILYVAPVMVANIGTGRRLHDWDAALAACRLSGAVFLEMYHGLGPSLRAAPRGEWRAYPGPWRAAMGRQAGRLHFLFTGAGTPQDLQWSWAASTPAGRKILATGAGAYRIGSRAKAIGWLRGWHRYTPAQATR